MSIFDIFDKLNAEKENTAAGKPEYIIVGLGNPGEQYANTRHNAGFMVIDKLAEKYNADVKKIKFKSLTGTAVISGVSCLLMKPSTFMNNSGEAVVEAMNFYKIPIENVIVCYDDISLEPSKLRIRRKGSDGGHNGIKSIIYLTGENTFPRIKTGVGAKPHKDYDLAAWVLSNFTADELKLMQEGTEKAVSALELMVKGKTDEAMNKFNS
ncbi:MAG: aminoacyl-tRNA hydrolase [Oscillospiraceae bacterium]|nr:aminoacyl-tRNA hydrolase [Oscillospiraceae bacterium]